MKAKREYNRRMYAKRRVIFVFVIIIVVEVIMLISAIISAQKKSEMVEQAKIEMRSVAAEYNQKRFSLNIDEVDEDFNIERSKGDIEIYISSKKLAISKEDLIEVKYPATFKMYGNVPTLQVGLDYPEYTSLVWNRTVKWIIVIILTLVTVIIAYKKK